MEVWGGVIEKKYGNILLSILRSEEKNILYGWGDNCPAQGEGVIYFSNIGGG